MQPFAILTNMRPAPVLASAIICLLMAGCAGSPRATAWAYPNDSITASSLHPRTDDDPIARLLAGGGLSPARDALVVEAMSHLGIRYRSGGNTPDKGFDCSGLVSYAAAKSLGLKLPRSAAEMAAWAREVDRVELVAGDLVFFNTMNRKYSHVGIYLGDNQFVHSPSPGGVVRVDNMTQAYWQARYNGARRIDSPAVLALNQR